MLNFFVSPELLKVLLDEMKNFPYLTYHAVNKKGISHTNATHNANAVTWGVFPGKEILQPTVVERDSFLVWKDEAFALWKTWAALYDEGTSRKIIDNIIENFYLMNIVDNNYVSGDTFAIFNHVINKK